MKVGEIGIVHGLRGQPKEKSQKILQHRKARVKEPGLKEALF